MTRPPVVAGQFYEDSPELLRQQIRDSFLHDLGPGSLPSKSNESVKAAIAPHAGYVFSGPCAAWAYKAIAEAQTPEVFLMLGPSHSGYNTCFSSENWSTPLGTVSTDKDFVEFLAAKTGIPIDNSSHAREHSIEVQLPFLQFGLTKFKIAPLMVSHDIDVHQAASSVRKAIVESKKKVCIIASSDFTHYGVNYGYMPFSSNKKENMYRLDQGAIDCILARKTGRFLDYVEDKKQTICGYLAIAMLLDAVESERAELLKYYTSGDVIHDYSSAVGYAAIVFR